MANYELYTGVLYQNRVTLNQNQNQTKSFAAASSKQCSTSQNGMKLNQNQNQNQTKSFAAATSKQYSIFQV